MAAQHGGKHIRGFNGVNVARVGLDINHTEAQIVSDARLIAAAPELLAALELAMSYIHNDHGRNPLIVRREAVDAAGAAIAKAKGE